MNVQKFFRRNMRMLLAVVTSLLLVGWLAQDALSGCRQGGIAANETLGQAFGDEVTTQDVLTTNNKLELAGNLGLEFRSPEPLDRLEQHLLVEESRRMGIHVSKSEAARFLTEARGMKDADLTRASQQLNTSPDSIYSAVAQYLAVQHALRLQIDGLVTSAARVEQQYRDQSQEASLAACVIDAKALLDRVPEPTPEELAAEFEAGKDRETAHTEESLVFGYKLPDRVSIEYLTIDPTKIENRVQVRESEAKEFYDAHKSRYMDRVPKPTTQTTQPVQPQFELIQLTYEQAKDRVKRDKRRLKAIDEAARAMNDIERRARGGWERAEVGEDGFLKPPPDAEQVPFEKLKEEFSAKYPVEHHKTELLDRSGLLSLPGIGRSIATGIGSRISFAEMAMRVKGLITSSAKDQVRGLNVMQPGPLFVTMGAGASPREQVPTQGFVFRVTQVAPAGPPESMEAVREKLIENVKTIKAFAMAREHAEKLERRAAEVGLAAALDESTELKQIMEAAEAAARAATQAASQPPIPQPVPKYVEQLGPTNVDKFTRQRPAISLGVSAPNLAKKIFETTPGAAAGPDAAATQAAHRVYSAPAARAQKVIVAELKEIRPLYSEPFNTARANVEARLKQPEVMLLADAWFDPANIRKRAGFKPAQ